MTADVARRAAVQARADEIVRMVGEAPESGSLLRVSVTDVESGQRLATCVVNVAAGVPSLRLVGGES